MKDENVVLVTCFSCSTGIDWIKHFNLITLQTWVSDLGLHGNASCYSLSSIMGQYIASVNFFFQFYNLGQSHEAVK